MKKPFFVVLGMVVVWLGLSASAGSVGLQDLMKGATQALESSGALKSGGGAVGADEISQGLKEALRIGSEQAVSLASRADGFYKNPKIKIPLPNAVQKVETLMRGVGFGSQVDAFDLSMNRAAEKAAPEAKALFLDAIHGMSIADAQKILNGRANEATLYFEEKTSGRLKEIFQPIVHQTMSEVGTTRTFQDLNTQLKSIPLAGSLSFDLDQYVTDGTLKGLFALVAEEEAKIRANPAARVTDLLRKVFGSR
jgi:hypothetical protein